MFAEIELNIPYSYYNHYCDCEENLALDVDDATKECISKIMAEEGVTELTKDMVQGHLDVLQSLNDSILQYGYELLVDDWLEPYNDGDGYETLYCSMDDDIQKGLFSPDYCPDEDYDYEESEDDESEDDDEMDDDEMHEQNRDEYIDWVDSHSQEFRAERYGVDMIGILCQDIDYVIKGVVDKKMPRPDHDTPKHDWTMADVYKYQAEES